MRRNWPTERVGAAPEHLISGVPAHVDGRMQGIAEDAGATMVNRDRMWAYVEGIHNWDPVWPDHAIRILPGPSSMWFDATGRRLEGMSGVPGADSIGAMKQILATGHDYSWFVLTQSIIEKEFALSGSEQNPDITGKDLKFLAQSRLAKGAPGPVEAFKEHGVDFVVADTLAELVTGMNELARGPELDVDDLERHIVARDREVDNAFSKDVQVMAIHNARRSRTDKLIRVAKPHKVLDPAHGPLIAVRLNILSRKTLGGLETDLDGQCVARRRHAASRACTPRARSPGSAAAACTATTRSRGPSSAAASSPAAPSAGRSRADSGRLQPDRLDQRREVVLEDVLGVGEGVGAVLPEHLELTRTRRAPPTRSSPRATSASGAVMPSSRRIRARSRDSRRGATGASSSETAPAGQASSHTSTRRRITRVPGPVVLLGRRLVAGHRAAEEQGVRRRLGQRPRAHRPADRHASGRAWSARSTGARAASTASPSSS